MTVMSALNAIASLIFNVLVLAAIVAAGFSVLFRYPQGLAWAKRAGLLAAGVLLLLCLLRSLTTLLAQPLPLASLLLLWLAASGIAYRIRAQRKSQTTADLRGAERMPLLPQHLHGEEER